MSDDEDEAEDSTGPEQEWCRWNTQLETDVVQEVFGYKLHLKQDPNSEHLGTTVWDSSIVMAKYLEKNSLGRGTFARSRMKGTTCLELGSGMGLGGIAAAMLGCHVTLTDVADVLPLLRHNATSNFNNDAWSKNVHLKESFGSVDVCELDWTKPEQLQNFARHYDYVVGTDCVYHEHLIADLLRVALHCTSPKTTLIVCNELRSESVANTFTELFGGHFKIRKVFYKDLHEKYRNPSIHMYILKRLREPLADAYQPPATAVHAGTPGRPPPPAEDALKQ